MTIRLLAHPVRLVPLLFLGFIAAGTLLLMLPDARAGAGHAPLLTALFTATSAVSVTGLIVVDTPTYWSPLGQAIIMLLFQIGGLGIMTAATLLGMLAGRGFGLHARMATQVERSRLTGTNVRAILALVLGVTVLIELLVALALAARFAAAHDFTAGQALWHGLFHAVSAFNNAGFSTFSDSLIGFRHDGWLLGPIALAVVIGALGFPVFEDLREAGWRRPSGWTLHTKMTVVGTAILLGGGAVTMLVTEWNNPDTLGPMAIGSKLLNAAFHSVMPRTAGFNSLDVAAFREETLVANYVLMLIGGGSAGTAGGIKVTTFMVLVAMAAAEVMRRREASLFGRRLGNAVERQAVAIVMLSLLLVLTGTMIITSVTRLPVQDVLFETISAFATVGMSTGITARLPPSALTVLIVLMFVGRVCTITVAAAFVLSGRSRRYRYPEENPLVG